jgi:glycine betaine/proline transport system ATP-binding protein
MDEAFSALDPWIRREMQDDLLGLQRDLGKTIVFITHDLNEALKLGDHTAIMRDGQVVQVGTADEIVSEPSNEYVLEFTRDVDRSRVLSIRSVMRQPDTLTAGKDTVRTASARMRAIDADYMVLVDADRRPLGIVIEEEVGPALQRGANDLSDVVSDSFVSCSADDLLIDTYEYVTEGHCIVAVDERGRLAGVAEHLDILSSLAPATAPVPQVSMTTPSSNGASAEPELPVGSRL